MAQFTHTMNFAIRDMQFVEVARHRSTRNGSSNVLKDHRRGLHAKLLHARNHPNMFWRRSVAIVRGWRSFFLEFHVVIQQRNLYRAVVSRFVPVLGTSTEIQICRHVDGLAW